MMLSARLPLHSLLLFLLFLVGVVAYFVMPPAATSSWHCFSAFMESRNAASHRSIEIRGGLPNNFGDYKFFHRRGTIPVGAS